ncbi:Zinc finger CCCH-type with G patch domain-containing protein [Morus notabilis]|uniref:Zinc finger CCCH-type with G patch domain-containing protein n=1 Tax=Morus notabilis TaxID=981085 RepID=W9SS07_9ROSA|nr:Zinc finger CCCH-type with G patch domain-containing protein [Morus notabilis]
MAGGRRRGRGRGRGRGKPNNNNESKNHRRKGSGPSYSSAGKGALFVEGGLLSDWSYAPTPSRGKNPSVSGSNNKSGSKSGSLDQTKAASGPKSGSRKSLGNTFRYQYTPFEQESLQPEPRHESNNEDNSLSSSRTIALVDSKDAQIFAYIDQTPSSRSQEMAFSYDYSSALGDGSHRGLGFSDELEETPSGVEASLKKMEEEEDQCFNSLSSEQEMSVEERNAYEVGVAMAEESPAMVVSPKRNSGFLSFGGMKLYTEDISDEESDGDEDGESVDEGSLVPIQEEQLGHLKVTTLKTHLTDLDESDDDTSSSSAYDGTVKKLGGIALQEASSEYGIKKANPRQKYNATTRDSWSSPLDDFMLIKDSRKVSAKKKHVARFPQSWPLGAHKSKSSKKFPGEKKKHRKEMIALKRRERMLRRGVDLEQINLKLEQIVLDGGDMYSFEPMHSRDCSQVRRLAAIYCLRSGCQGSGKKGFVTVTRTPQTCMPSSSDRVRLEKKNLTAIIKYQLIGADSEDADFSVVETPNIKSTVTAGIKQKKASANRHRRSNERQNGKRESYARQPVSFVSSGVMQSETVEDTAADFSETNSGWKNKEVAGSANFGAFEEHTKGFGSKMMAKMGFIEGGGLGKEGKGIAEPIEVIKRPKSLGLGVEFSHIVDDTASNDPASSRPLKSKSQKLGAFEKHTKGFGSKMMAKMGFVEGKGLGKDSQGIVNPIKRPKSLGLGVEFSHIVDDTASSDPASSRPLKSKSQKLGAFEKHTKGFGSKMMAKMGFVEGKGLGKDSQGIVNPLLAVRLPKSRGLGAKD